MNIHVRQPTSTELKAIERHRAFHQAIAKKGAALEAAKKPTCVSKPRAQADAAIGPEAMPAETDPPICGLPDTFFVLPKYDGLETTARIKIADIQMAVCRHYGVSVGDLLSPSRTAKLAYPRRLAMYLARELTHRSWHHIGRLFRRDHTTAIHAIRKVAGELLQDANLAHDVALLIEAITGTAS
ncbi:helix-turn-helix domain-containing protein [Bradyrhizobium sp.]|uniref:helix-turn-helix domain-containing protein n=1 Tax=Bradyrhizobium sp. TaxID=376 RepID=UPI003C609F4D